MNTLAGDSITTVALMEAEEEAPPSDDLDCLQLIADHKWPQGFTCQRCGAQSAKIAVSRRTMRCGACKDETSITAGTIFFRCKAPLPKLMKMLWNLANGSHKNANQTSAELQLSYSTVWLWEHKFRTVIEQLFSQFGQTAFTFEKLKHLLFRRSRESSSNQTFSAGDLQETNEDPENERPIKPETEEATVHDIALFIAENFQGISRKYLQKYAVEFSLKLWKEAKKFKALLGACGRIAPIERNEILLYSSASKVNVIC